MTSRSILALGWLLASGLSYGQVYSISPVAGGATQLSPTVATATSILAATTDAAGNVYFATNNCVYMLDQHGALTLVAGSTLPGFAGDGGQAVAARLNLPQSLAFDAAGNLFIAEGRNSRIRRVSLAGVIATVAPDGLLIAGLGTDVTATIGNPIGVGIDAAENVFIASADGRVQKVSPAGIISVVAGWPVFGCGPVSLNNFPLPGLAVDSTGNVFLAACGRVVKISPDGNLTTVAGIGTRGFSGDGGAATNAQLGYSLSPISIALDGAGNLFIGDSDNNRVRKVSTSGTITTVAGNGTNGATGDGGRATNAQIIVGSIAVDGAGNLYIVTGGSIRKVSVSGIITTAVASGVGALGDGGPAVNAQLPGLHGLAVDGLGNIYAAEVQADRVRKISPDGVITTVAGNGTEGFSGDGGPAVDAKLDLPTGVAVDNAGNLYIADSGSDRVRRVSPGGIITTVAGNSASLQPFSGDGGPAINAHLANPFSVAVDGSGNLFISDGDQARIRKVSPDGIITTVAGNGTLGFSGDNGPAISAEIGGATDLAVDSSGNLFITDHFRVRRISPDGLITTVVGDGSGEACLTAGGPSTRGSITPGALAVDSAGDLFFKSCASILKVSPGGIITLVAGSGTPGISGDTGPASNAQLNLAGGIALDNAGNVFIGDAFGPNPFYPTGGVIRRLQPTSQAVMIGAVLDAASEMAVPLSPGKIVVIYGAGLGPPQLVRNQPANGFFGTQVSGTTVTIDGLKAPMIYASATQLAAIVPYGVSLSSAVQVTVSSVNGVSAPFPVAVQAAAPSFFSQGGTGAGLASVVNLDGSLNGPAHPVKIGDYVQLYATGEGQTSPAGVDGKLAAGPLYPKPLLPVTVTVGGVAAPYSYAGAAPTLVAGLMQINVRIPQGVQPGGYVPVVLTVGNSSTIDGAAWIAVSGN